MGGSTLATNTNAGVQIVLGSVASTNTLITAASLAASTSISETISVQINILLQSFTDITDAAAGASDSDALLSALNKLTPIVGALNSQLNYPIDAAVCGFISYIVEFISQQDALLNSIVLSLGVPITTAGFTTIVSY